MSDEEDPVAFRDSEEESSEEEEEEEQSKRKKKRSSSKRKKSKIIEEEAGEDDDEEYDDEYDTLKREEEQKGSKLTEDMIRQQDLRRAQMKERASITELSAEEIARRLEQKHAGRAATLHPTSMIGVSSDATIEAARFVRNRPTPADPKLFALGCKGGEENALVLTLYQKYIRDQARSQYATPGAGSAPQFRSRFHREIAPGKELEILSIVAPGTTGIIYIEAMHKDAVEAAINGVDGIYKSRITIVKVEEMTDVMRVEIRKDVVRKGDFVRLRGPFPYKGDLAQVVNVQDAGTKLTVRVLPRIDFSTIESASLRGMTKRPTAASTGGVIPPAKLFIAEEIRAAGGIVSRETFQLTGTVMDMYNNQFFDTGLLYLELGTRQVSQLTGDSPYTQEEVAVFSNALEDNGGGKSVLDTLAEQRKRKTLTNITAANKRLGSEFSIGDFCRVVRGPDAGMEGVIGSLNMVQGTASLNTANLKLPLQVRLADLVKQFKLGDNALIVNGRDRGKTGKVVQVLPSTSGDAANPRVLLMTDANEELEVFNADLRLSNELAAVGSVGGGATRSLDGHALYDLVQLDQNLHAIVVSVGSRTLRILTQSGEVKEISSSAIRAKKNMASKDAVVADRANALIRINDPVHVVSGPHQGASGTVKQIYAQIIFLFDRKREGVNAGIIVVKGKDCKLESGVGIAASNAAASAAAARGGGARAATSRPPRDELVGKTVRIRRGDDKGMVGTVVEGGDATKVRVELNARNRITVVSRQDIVPVEVEMRSGMEGGDVGMYGAHMAAYALPEDLSSQQAPATPSHSYYDGYGHSGDVSMMSAGAATSGSSAAAAAASTSQSFSAGQSVKLLDTGESVTVYNVVDARDVVVKTGSGEYKIIAASNLVNA